MHRSHTKLLLLVLSILGCWFVVYQNVDTTQTETVTDRPIKADNSAKTPVVATTGTKLGDDHPVAHKPSTPEPEIPDWADPNHSSESWTRAIGGELVHYHRFIRLSDGSPIIQAQHTKAARPDEILYAYAFHAERLLVDTASIANHKALLPWRLESSPQRTFAAIYPQVHSANPFAIVELAEQLAAMGVEGIEYDVLVYTTVAANDPRFDDQWHLVESNSTGHIDAERAWETRTSAEGVVVAVLDTGVRITHQDLDDNLWTNPSEIAGDGIDNDNNGYIDDVHGVDTNSNTGDPDDPNGHGTHVAGIIGAEGNNNQGVSGVAWDVDLMAIRFMNSDGIGYLSDAIEGIDYAYAHGADIINCSFATYSYSSLFLQAIERARDADSIIVAAAGNEGNDLGSVASYPAAYTTNNIVSVASTDSDGGISSFSNYSSTLVDLAAPGRNILATYHSSDASYQSLSGTSMATPVVAGILALARAEFPSDSIQDLIDRLNNAVVAQSELSGKTVTGGYASLFNTLSSVDPSLLPNIQFQENGPLILHAGYAASINLTSTGASADFAWYFENSATGETGSEFAWSDPSASDSGTYSAVASNTYGTDTASIEIEFMETNSQIAQVTGLASLPWITYGDGSFTANGNSVQSGSITHNQSVSLQTRSPAEGTLSLDIDVSSEANYDFLDIFLDGQTLASYAGEVTLNDFEIEFSGEGQILEFRYTKDATVTRGDDNVVLSDFEFTVAGAPNISTQPSDLTLINEESASVSFTVANAVNAQYLWERDGETIAETSEPSLQFHFDKEPGLGTYQVHITVDDTTLVTDAFTVSNVNTPVITEFSGPSSVILGETAEFSVEATGGDLSYRWVKDNAVISSATGTSLSLEDAAAKDAGNYWVIVYNEAGSVSSASIILEVTGGLPEITSHPESATLTLGDSYTLSVSATGPAPLTYQWYLNGEAIAGANSNTYTIRSASSDNLGNYSCTVKSSAGSVTSNMATIRLSGEESGVTYLSVGDLDFEIFYRSNSELSSTNVSWTIANDQNLVLRSTIIDSGAYGFEVEGTDSSLVWRVDGSEVYPHFENDSYWLALDSGNVVECVVSNGNNSSDSAQFTLADTRLYPEANGPVLFAPSGLEIIQTSGAIEELITVISNSAYRLDWTLVPLDVSQSEISSKDFILNQSFPDLSGYFQFSGTVENGVGQFALPEFYINVEEDLTHPFTDATELSEGWIFDDNFGALNITSYPWIFSSNHGWWYIDTTTEDFSGFWLFDFEMGWLRTSTTHFPYAWSRNLDRNIYLHAPSQIERWYYDFSSGTWQSIGRSEP